MSVSIDIVPSADSIDMIGHVSIALTSPYALYGPRRTARILLHSVTLTFEGQSEVLTPQTGYSAVRLCTETRDITPPEPVEMNNEGHEDSGKPCYWNVLFDMSIPGWLPPSAVYGVEGAGVRYTLFAEVKYTVVCDNNNSFSLSHLCSPFRSRIRNVETLKDILLRRLIAPYEDSHTNENMVLQPQVTYLINPKYPKDTRFPTDILSTLQVLVTVPEHIDIEHHSFPVTIRMRTKGLPADNCKRLQVNSVSVNVVQKERYRTTVVEGYYHRYPISPPKHQPPHVPLRDPHPMAAIYESGLGGCVAHSRSVIREFSLLPPDEPGFYSLGDNNYPFSKDAEQRTWYTMETSVPFVHQITDDKTVEWSESSIIRPSVYSPLISILHEAAIELNCAYALPETDEIVTERIFFSFPLRFQLFAPDTQSSYYAFALSGVLPTQPGLPEPSLRSSKPYTSSLPAYSQLFDSNGDRKVDHNPPLPLYTPRASPNASSTSLSLDLDTDSDSEGIEAREIDPLLSSRYSYESD
ncbi:hypothetical protein C0989_008037 [Termitomyces sp. Mn162]|nr:hypothetical protein C0989_008037 [Termitomyces sp. Mn162]